MGINTCPECLKKQQQIDRLQEENRRLKEKLRYRERQASEGFFGSSTPSAKLPLKANTTPVVEKKKPGARNGHPGRGRKPFDEHAADRVVDLPMPAQCPSCGARLVAKEVEHRMVLESQPVRAEKILYRAPKMFCPHCRRTIRAQPPGVLPKSLYGNQLIATSVAMHYLHGIPMGRVCAQLGIEAGSLMEIFHRLGRLLAAAPAFLVERYRQAPVKHADETGWRTAGRNGYAWLFATEKLSIFRFRRTRSATVCREVFGTEPLPGVLLVDRYAAYKKTPCAMQYCYAHLLRNLEDLGKEFEDDPEVKRFVDVLAPLLSSAMSLRRLALSEEEFRRRASETETQIKTAMQAPANHLGIRAYQDLFRENEDRLYHWARDRTVPADNNLAERDLRPTVIARKVSFGSQSEKGAKTREIIMTVIHTLKKQRSDPVAHLKSVLDRIAVDPALDPLPLLFPT